MGGEYHGRICRHAGGLMSLRRETFFSFDSVLGTASFFISGVPSFSLDI